MWLKLFFILSISINLSTGCPDECECYYTVNLFEVDCSRRNLENLPVGLDTEIQALDLSVNHLSTIPTNISAFTLLQRLNFSGNIIQYIDGATFSGLINLHTLDLSNNKFEKWSDLEPNIALKPMKNIKRLILSSNKLETCPNEDISTQLRSDSLEVLEISNCAILSCEVRFYSLTALKILIMSHNPIRKMQIFSPTLDMLDISHCEFRRFTHNVLNFLPSLNSLFVSHNRLDISRGASLTSASLKNLDISFCSMNRIKLSNLPNLQNVTLRGNMLKQITGEEFVNNTKIEYLDMSSNSIETIQNNSFDELISLKYLDLSINVIGKVHEGIFANNPNLSTVIMSRNYISYLGNLVSSSIQTLDMRICEIQLMAPDVFVGMISLQNVYLGKNMIKKLPNLKSSSIRILDLSYNRISSIDDDTFKDLPELKILHLSENRFTTTFKISYFENNTKLSEISLGENMWRCECYNEEMRDFFMYLVDEPSKIFDLDKLLCQSPSNVTDDTWWKACHTTWNPENSFTTNRAMNFLIAAMGAFLICFCILYIIRSGMKRRMMAEEEERRRQTEETRERLRQLEMAREQEAMINAPDPRDVISPPSYDEALLMPKLDRSFHSLSNLNQAGKQKRRARRRTKSSGDLLEESTSDESNQSRRRRSRDGSSNRRYKRTKSSSNIDTTNDENSEDIELQPNVRRVQESDL